MTRPIPLLPLATACALGLVLAACTSGPKVDAVTPPAVATAADEIDAIAALLDHGALRDARHRLDAALLRDPMNPSLLVLRQGIVGDAKADLGPASYAYAVAAGDTMPGIAERFLGNRLKSYQLARYNNIDNPAALARGQVLRIPGQPARSASDRIVEPRRATGTEASAAGGARATATAPPPPPPATVAPTGRSADAAGARRARTAGLAALNQGDVAEAVALLQRAAALDPGNPAIERDLSRARRIAGTVQARR
jgi:LysM repeat protein